MTIIRRRNASLTSNYQEIINRGTIKEPICTYLVQVPKIPDRDEIIMYRIQALFEAHIEKMYAGCDCPPIVCKVNKDTDRRDATNLTYSFSLLYYNNRHQVCPEMDRVLTVLMPRFYPPYQRAAPLPKRSAPIPIGFHLILSTSYFQQSYQEKCLP